MKKISAYIIAIFSFVLVACQKEIQEPQQTGQDGKVTFNLDFTVPEAGELTKALGEEVDLATNGLWVVVYDHGYRTEVVKATDLTLADASTNKYTCTLTLTVADKARNLHFISMAGFSASDAPYEETRFGSLTSADGLDAYWQIRTVSKIPYNLVTTDWNKFLGELKGSTGTITLVRNFAKVTMTNSATNFALTSFKVFKTPSKGYVAPYISSGSSNGFVFGYDQKEYNAALSAYPGRMPNDCTLSGYSTADVDGTSFTPASGSQYFYERPVPTEEPAFIIVKGKFGATEAARSSAAYSYYKINLRDKDDNYYALLRGFRFKVNIEKVTAEGYSSVIEAYNSAGSGDISTSLEYSSINNIADGVCRLFVNATSFTQIKADTIELKYKFIPDYVNQPTTVKNDLVDVDDETKTGVEITVNSPEAGIQPSIAKNSSDQWDYVVGTSDTDGWRTITVKTNNPESLYKEQVITIRGRGSNGSISTVLQRDIHVIVRPTLTLYAEMADGYSTIGFGKDKDVKLNIWMEDELPQSIFPLNVKIEAVRLTLTPAPGEQLPVESGQSASTTDPKPAFYFVRTITWSDYTGASTATKNVGGVNRKMHKFVCNFKTNADESATSIYVSHELFNTSSTSFTNATSLSLSPVSPGDWSATATEEPYAGQTFNATIKASVPAGTTVTGTTKVGGSSTNVTASVSGTILTITRTGMSYSTSGFKDLAVSTTLSTGSFSFTPKVVVWTKYTVTRSAGQATSLSNDAYLMITSKSWNEDSYFIYENNSNQPYLSNSNVDNNPKFVWQLKDWNTSAMTGKLLNYSSGRYLESASSNSISTTSTTSTVANYGTFNITYDSTNSCWQIRNTGITGAYMNRFGGGTNTNIGYYTVGSASDSGSRWKIYTCTVTPCTRPAE